MTASAFFFVFLRVVKKSVANAFTKHYHKRRSGFPKAHQKGSCGALETEQLTR